MRNAKEVVFPDIGEVKEIHTEITSCNSMRQFENLEKMYAFLL